ncbi:hypothetical protein Vretimale_14923, partial [Volvox reticuliferus]
ASMLELHDALTTEKSQGLFARRGAWETRLRELAEGGNNHACLQVLWSEMAEGIRLWLAGGSALPGTPGGITTTPAATGGTSMPPYSRSYDGTASDRGGDAYMGQPLSEDDYYMAAAAAHQHHQSVQHLQQPSPFLDYAATAGPPGSGRGGNGAAAAAAACRPPATPWMMRSELSVLLQSVDAELDTDLDEGPDATDVEGEDGGENDSDVDPLAAARRLRRRRLRCRQISEHDEQRRQQQQPDQQPAPPADAEMPDAETAAAAEGEQQDGGVSGGAGMPIEAPAPAAAAAVEATPGRGKVEGADSGDSTTDANAAGEAAAPASGTGVAEPMDVDSGTPGPPPSGLGSTTEAALGGMPEAPGVPGGGEGSS